MVWVWLVPTEMPAPKTTSFATSRSERGPRARGSGGGRPFQTKQNLKLEVYRPLSQVNRIWLAYVIIRSSYTPYSIYLRGTIVEIGLEKIVSNVFKLYDMLDRFEA